MAVQPPPPPAPATGTRRVDFDPVSRVAGALAFHTQVDLDKREVLETASLATLFRGYEVILEGRDVRDAIFISSRACGVCGGAHATASALACEMVFGVHPPPMGIVARNLLSATECLYDYPTHLFLRAGPDFSEATVRETNPELWARAETSAAPGFAEHGFERMADIMIGLNRKTGELYLEALRMARIAREAYVLTGGKFPHPQTIVPGGISATIDPSDMNVALLRIVKFFDYGRKVVAVWDDLAAFFQETAPRFRELGAGPMNFLDLGLWDDPFAYDGTFENSAAWGQARWATPGAIVDGRLRTIELQLIDAGVEEFVDHSHYDDWTGNGGPRVPTDAAGNRLSANHPWNKRTLPHPGDPGPRGGYSWSTAARWQRHAMETGAGARLFATALAGQQPHHLLAEATGHSLRLSVPQATLPAGELEWHVPQQWNVFERHRARAYALMHAALVAYENLIIGYDLTRKSGEDAKVFTPYTTPKGHLIGVGLWGSARGYLSHHMEIDGGVIQNYQIVGPSTFTASPTDAFGTPGPIEQAVRNTPLLSSAQPERCIDILRTIRSFDPCMACATH